MSRPIIMETGLHWLDWGIIAAYLAGLSAIGFHFSQRQETLKDFLLAGQRVAWLPVGLSMMAALNSGIDYLMHPSSAIKYGIVLLLAITTSAPLYFWTTKVTIPFYRRLKVFTAYEYLERRFDLRVRLLAAAIYLFWRLGWMATAMYVPCLAISTVTEGRVPLATMIFILGGVVTLYTMLGGMKAVIWTNVLQFGIMFGGLVTTVVMITLSVPGGLGEIWNVGQLAGKTSWTAAISGGTDVGVAERIVRFLQKPITATGLIISTTLARMAIYTADQVMVQRIQTTRSVRESRQAILVDLTSGAFWTSGLIFVGLSLFAYLQHYPLPSDLPSDLIFPHFVVQTFPIGLTGLIIAAILAASLSSTDSAINACTAVVVVDFYNRLFVVGSPDDNGKSLGDQQSQIRVSRTVNVIVGVTGTVLAANVGRLGDLIEITNKVVNSFTGPLLGIYVLGMFLAGVRAIGVLVAGFVGTAITIWIAFFTDLSFLWPTVFGLASTLLVGVVSCVTHRRKDVPQSQWTFRNVMRNDPESEAAAASPDGR